MLLMKRSVDTYHCPTESQDGILYEVTRGDGDNRDFVVGNGKAYTDEKHMMTQLGKRPIKVIWVNSINAIPAGSTIAKYSIA